MLQDSSVPDPHAASRLLVEQQAFLRSFAGFAAGMHSRPAGDTPDDEHKVGCITHVRLCQVSLLAMLLARPVAPASDDSSDP